MREWLENGAPRRFEGLRVLVAEDSELNRALAVELLRSLGIRTGEAADGIVALEMVTRGDYDLILMDVRMPRMDGHETTRRIRRLTDPRKAGIPILALTSDTAQEDRAAAFRAGMDDFLEKPVALEPLCRAMARILE